MLTCLVLMPTSPFPSSLHSPAGHAPLLQPQEAFEYVSGTQLATPHGTIEGSFQMVRSPGPMG